MNLARRAVSGMIWAYTVFFGGRAATLITTAILARILVPDDFGLIGLALLLLNFIDATQDFGIKEALIYNTEREEDTIDTAFWMNVGIGLIQFGVAFLLAPLALSLTEDVRVVTMIRVMSLVFIVNSLGNTHDTLLQKELSFRKRYLPQLYSAVIKGVASIIMALIGWGVWSLVIGHVIGAVVRTIAKWVLKPWRPRLRFFRSRARALWGYGVYILLINILTVALEQADQTIIAILLTETQLGYYTIGARIPEMVIANFSLLLTYIIFPIFTRMNDDLEKLTQGFLLTTKYTGFVTIPAGFGLAAIAPELVIVVFGDQWGPAIPLLQVLAFLGMMVTLPWSAGDVFKAIGRPDISTKLMVVEALYSFPLIWLLAYRWPVAVVASAANLLAVSITAVLRLLVVSRFLKIKPSIFPKLFFAPFVGAIAMFLVVNLWRALTDPWPMWATLITAIPIGAVVYAFILFLMEREEIQRIREFAVDYIRSRRSDEDDELETEFEGALSGLPLSDSSDLK